MLDRSQKFLGALSRLSHHAGFMPQLPFFLERRVVVVLDRDVDAFDLIGSIFWGQRCHATSSVGFVVPHRLLVLPDHRHIYTSERQSIGA